VRLIEVKNPQGIILLAPHFVGTRDYSIEQIAFDIMCWLYESPDDTYIESLWSDDNKLMGFFVAYIPEKRKHVFVAQAWLDPQTVHTTWPEDMFDRIKTFARLHDLNEIRTETLKRSLAISRRWHFEPFSTIMTFDLNKEIQNADD